MFQYLPKIIVTLTFNSSLQYVTQLIRPISHNIIHLRVTSPDESVTADFKLTPTANEAILCLGPLLPADRI